MAPPDLTPIVRAARSAEPAAKPYDFARPQTFSDRQIRDVAAAHTALAEGLAVALSDALGGFVAARCAGVAEVEAQDFEASRARPTALFVEALGPHGPGFVVDMAAALALHLIERQLGGTDPFEEAPRALSALEQAMIQRDWLPLFGVAFADAWATTPPLPLQAGDDAARLALSPAEAVVVVASLEIEVGGGASRMAIAYPAATLRALLAGASAEAPPPTPGPDRVGDLGIDVRAELGRTRLAVSDLTRLAPGDLIPLGRVPGMPIPVWIGDRLHFEARAGTRGGRLALEVLTPPATPPD